MGFINRAVAATADGGGVAMRAHLALRKLISRPVAYERFMGKAGAAWRGGVEGVSRGIEAVGGPVFGFMGRNLAAPAAGAAIGGIYGGATSDSMTATGTFKDVISGAAAGLGIGLLGSRAVWKGIGGLGRGLGRGAVSPYRRELANRIASNAGVDISRTYMKDLREGLIKGTLKRSDFGMGIRDAAGAAYRGYIKPAGGAVLGAGKLAGGAGAFVAQHPLVSLAVGGGTLGALSIAAAAGQQAPVAEQERRLMAEGRSSTAMESRQAFENSTIGLVQGLHRSRRSR